MKHQQSSLTAMLPAFSRFFAFVAGTMSTLSAIASDKAPILPPPVTTPSSSGSIFTMVFGLLLVLGIMMSIAWLLKRTGLSNISGNGAPLKVIGGVSVGARERVMVVEVADQWIVVGVAPGRVNTLATLPRQEHTPVTASPATKNFSSWLKQTIDKRHER